MAALKMMSARVDSVSAGLEKVLVRCAGLKAVFVRRIGLLDLSGRPVGLKPPLVLIGMLELWVREHEKFNH